MKKLLFSTIAAFGLLCGVSQVNAQALVTSNLTDQLDNYDQIFSSSNMLPPQNVVDAGGDPLSPGNQMLVFREFGDSTYPSAGALTYRAGALFKFDRVEFSFAGYASGGFAANTWVRALDKNGTEIPLTIVSSNPSSVYSGQQNWTWYRMSSASGLAGDNAFDMSEVSVVIRNENDATSTNAWATGFGTVNLTVAQDDAQTLITANLTDQLDNYNSVYSRTNMNGFPQSVVDAGGDPLSPGNQMLAFRTAGDLTYPSPGSLTYRTGSGFEFDQVDFSFAVYNLGFGANIWVRALDRNGTEIPLSIVASNPSVPTGDPATSKFTWYRVASASGLAGNNTFDMSEVSVVIRNENDAASTNAWAAGIGTVNLTVAQNDAQTLLTANLTDQLDNYNYVYSRTNMNGFPQSVVDAGGDPMSPDNQMLAFRTAGDLTYPSPGTLNYRTGTGFEFDQVDFSFAVYNFGFGANIWVRALDKNGTEIPLNIVASNPSVPTGDPATSKFTWYRVASASGLAGNNSLDMSEVSVVIRNDNDAASTNAWAAGFGTVNLTVVPEQTATNTFANWMNGFNVGALVGFNDDPDNDGLANALENILGSSPEAANNGISQVSASGGNLSFRHTLSATPADDLAASYEWSVDLASWNASGATANGTTVTFGTPSVITPGTPDLVEVIATIEGTAVSKVFARLKVTQVTP